MLVNDFNNVVTKRLDKIRELLVTKGNEYAKTIDRLYNFKRGAQLSKTTPEDYARDLMIKHFVWFLDAIDAVDSPTFFTDFPEAKFDEHIGDIDVYMILIEGLFRERYNKHYGRKTKNEQKNR